jgi:long-subunit fatty acid transport protein
MKRLLLIMTTAMIMAATGFAVNPNAGTASAQFLKLGAGARASGMGEAFAGVADDATAIYWNPAGLSNLDSGSLSVMHATWFGGINYEWAAYAQPVGNIGVLGVGVQYLSYGALTKLDETGLEGGTFSPADMAASLSYAGNVGGFGVGINLKYISMKIEATATAYAADIGIQRKVGTSLTLGLAAQNMGSSLKFISEEDPMPLNIKFGGAYAIADNWIAALDANSPNDDDITLGAGTEYVWALADKMGVAGRLGYTTVARDTGGLNGLTVGLGFTYEGYTVDYAYVPYGDLGDTQRISLSVKF